MTSNNGGGVHETLLIRKYAEAAIELTNEYNKPGSMTVQSPQNNSIKPIDSVCHDVNAAAYFIRLK